MRLYLHPFSSNARRAHLAALELGLSLELVVVDLAKGEQRKPEFLRKNPNGAVPVLEDGDFVLTESHAIMQYLAEQTPGQTLWPAEARARADVNRWMFWNAHHFQPAVSVLVWERVVRPMLGQGGPDPREEERGTALVARTGRVLDDHLRGKSWISQDRLTLADLALASTLTALEPARLPLTDHPHLASWLERVKARPSWKATERAA